MKLRDLHVQGFGIFHDLSLSGLSPHLTMVLGSNEAGKSTLVGFIRAMLFGFPDGRTLENSYPPLAGGRHGGRLTLTTAAGQSYVLQRFAGPRGGLLELFSDTGRNDAALLPGLLGFSDRNFFKNIFAFSLTELQELETLNLDAIREILYSAGAGLGAQVLLQIKIDLEKIENDLYKANAKKPEINLLLQDLANIKRDKKQIEDGVKTYDHLKTRIQDLDRRIRALNARRQTLLLDLKKIEKKVLAWPAWQRFAAAGQKIAALEPIPHFPPQALARLDRLKLRYEDLQKDLLEKEAALQQGEAELAALKIDPLLLDQAEAVPALQKNQGHFETSFKELRDLDLETAQARQALREIQNRLGPSWDEAKLRGFDLSIAFREQVRQYRKDQDQAEWDVKTALLALQNNTAQKRDLAQRLSEAPEPSEKNPEQLIRKKKSLQELHEVLARAGLKRTELEYGAARLTDLEQEKNLLHGNQEGQTHPWVPWLVSIMLGLLAAAAWLIALRDNRPAWALIGSLAMGAWVIFFFKQRKRPSRPDKRLLFLQQKIAELRAKQVLLQQELLGLESAIGQIRASERLPGDSSSALLQEKAQALEIECRRLEEWLKLFKEKQHLEQNQERLARQHAEAQARQEGLGAQWRAFLSKTGLEPALSTDGVLEALRLVESGQGQIGLLHKTEARSQALTEARTRQVELANKVLAVLGRPAVTFEKALLAIPALIEEYQQTRQSAQKRDLLLQDLQARRAALVPFKKQVAEIQQEITALIRQGRAENEEHFRERALTHEKLTALQHECGQAEAELKRIFPAVADPRALEGEFDQGDLQEIEKQKLQLDAEWAQTEEALDEQKREQAKVEEKITQLLQDDRMILLQAQEETLLARLAEAAEKWGINKTAQTLLRLARERYEKEHQPEILRQAAHFLKDLTAGNYTDLWLRSGENMEVVGQNHEIKEPAQLSRGTAEQLYLALRFGFIREYAKRSEPLPILMDEILVNFDPERTRATVRNILALSQDFQILFFTCRPETVALFREMQPEIPVLEIGGGKIKA